MSTIETFTQIKLEQPLINLDSLKKKSIHIAIFGHGNVGSHLIDQILASQEQILHKRDLNLKIFAIANSKKIVLDNKGIKGDWRILKSKHGKEYSMEDVLDFTRCNELENLVAIDNTADSDFVLQYHKLVKAGFSLVSSNKIGNTIDLDFYKDLRKTLFENKKEYLYETNVGAGLPLIDTIKLLHLSGENITRIKGVFSGSLSYIFNEFSDSKKSFSQILKQAIDKGFTEPDAREDLCGNDVGRKLLILARELDLDNEIEDISIQNLIPKQLRKISKEKFLKRIEELDIPFNIKRKNMSKGHVLRYVGDLHGDLSKVDGAILDVQLVEVPKNSALGSLTGSDSIFEIYTESYGKNPIIIQGAGAGAEVTARGVFGDILRLSHSLN